MIPFGTSMKDRRIGAAGSAASAGVMASSTGRASTAPVPRRKARRGIDFLAMIIADPPHLEWGALDDTENDGRPPIVVQGSRARDLAQRSGVVFLHAAAQSIGHEPLGEGCDELILFAEQELAQALRPVEPGAVGQHAAGIDGSRPGAGRVAPAAEAVEVLQRKAHGIHRAVANGASGIGPVLLHAFTHGPRPGARILLQRWNIGRRRGG